METVGFKTRDGFLYCMPRDLATKGSTVVRDMVQAHEAMMDAPPPSNKEDVAVAVQDDASSMVIINVNGSAKAMDCATWCLVDKELYMKFPKDGIPAELISAALGDDDAIDEAMQLAYEMDF